jgi:fluoride ion exporter CrcB/FEX
VGDVRNERVGVLPHRRTARDADAAVASTTAAVLATGILGGFTTFSTFAVDTDRLLPDHVVVALVYFFGTILAALVATVLGELAVKGVRR